MKQLNLFNDPLSEIALWQERAGTSGAIGIGIHMEEMAEWLETLVISGPDKPSTEVAKALREVVLTLDRVATAVKRSEVTVIINNREKFLDAIGDQIVTAVAAGVCNGMQVIPAVVEINKSNWSKFEDGFPIYDSNGKVVRGANFKRPDLSGLY